MLFDGGVLTKSFKKEFQESSIQECQEGGGPLQPITSAGAGAAELVKEKDTDLKGASVPPCHSRSKQSSGEFEE